MLSWGSAPMKPGQAAPKAVAPARCSAASSRPNRSAASGVGSPGSTHSSASSSGSATITSGTATAPASRSQRSPAASAAKKPSGTGRSAPSGQDLAKTESPSSRVSRAAAQMAPPATGVSRIRWWVRKVGRCCRVRPQVRQVHQRTVTAPYDSHGVAATTSALFPHS